MFEGARPHFLRTRDRRHRRQINMDSSTDSRRYAHENEPELSPLEQEVLDEYAKLVGNLDDACQSPRSPSALEASLTTV